jgi:hypothetical protein
MTIFLQGATAVAMSLAAKGQQGCSMPVTQGAFRPQVSTTPQLRSKHRRPASPPVLDSCRVLAAVASPQVCRILAVAALIEDDLQNMGCLLCKSPACSRGAASMTHVLLVNAEMLPLADDST